jgi:hypothetical protein
MRLAVFGISLLMTFLLTQKSSAQVEKYRDLYFAARGEEGIKANYNVLNNAEESNAVITAYKGVAIAMYAEVVKEVSSKFDYFNRGKALIEKAIQKDFYNPEIRFLRYSVQAEVPWVVGYSSNLEEDAKIILNALKQNKIDRSSTFWKKAILFMLNSDELSSELENELKKYQS